MAPEQLKDPSDVDQRADIYSLGVVFYELLTGELPAGSFIPPSQKSGADPRVDAIVQQALQTQRERRQHSADEMRTQVETVTGKAPAAPPQAPAGTKWLLARIAASFWAMSVIIAVIASTKVPNPPPGLLWAILASAILAVVLAIPVRSSRFGKGALIGGAINLALWLGITLFSTRIGLSPATPAVSTDFHCLAFEEDAASVDKLIPSAARRATDANASSEFLSAQGSRGVGSSNVSTGGATEINSQVAEVSQATLEALLQEVQIPFGLLVNHTRSVSSDWWKPGMPDSWSFSRAGLELAGSGGGIAYLGLRQEKGQDQIRISCQVTDNIDIVADFAGPAPNVISTLSYEGILPKSDTLVFLVPFIRRDNSARYLVVIYQFGKEVDVAANVPVAVTTALATRGDLSVYLRALGQGRAAKDRYSGNRTGGEENARVVFAIPEDDVQAVVRKMDARQPLAVDVYDRSLQKKLAEARSGRSR